MKKLSTDELNRLSKEEFICTEKLPVIVILDNVRSLMNVGSIFRTCDAFRIEKLYLTGITGCPPNRDISKTALGATESVNWKYYKTALEAIIELKQEGYTVYAIEQTSNSQLLNQIQIKSKCAVVFGNEVNGVDQKVIDACNAAIEIPQEGTKHSLNVSVTAGIICWEVFKQLKKLL